MGWNRIHWWVFRVFELRTTRLQPITGYFPCAWKSSKVTLLIKPNREDRTEPSSYRPICVLNTLAKVFERLIHSRLTWEEKASAWFSNYQHEFIGGHSTVSRLFPGHWPISMWLTTVSQIEMGFQRREQQQLLSSTSRELSIQRGIYIERTVPRTWSR